MYLEKKSLIWGRKYYLCLFTVEQKGQAIVSQDRGLFSSMINELSKWSMVLF